MSAAESSSGAASTGGKVMNGYGVATSRWSVTNIGGDAVSHHAELERQQAADAAAAVRATGHIHPRRRDLSMQAQYPLTLSRLNQYPLGQRNPMRPPTSEPRRSLQKEPDPSTALTLDRSVREEEFQFNSRRREFNRSSAQQATVHKVFKMQDSAPAAGSSTAASGGGDGGGRSGGAVEEERIFPQGASHLQLLVLDKKFAMPDARARPPAVAPKVRWQGDMQGWSDKPI